jgi:putative DNA primase/helicase
LHEVIKADEVLIVEGEKDADTARGMGFIATTSPMGAKKWRDEYTPYLQGKAVVLIPDNDNEGREHMTQVGAALRDRVKTLKWLELPDVPSKGDLTDWARNIPNREEAAERLAILIDNARDYHPPKKYTLEDAVLEAADYDALTLPEKETILHPIIKEQQIILASGWRGVGKSWFGLGLLDAITRGEYFGPWEARKSVNCLYCDGEMAARDNKERRALLNPDATRQSRLYVYSDAYGNLLGLPRANLLSETWRSNMKRILITHGIKVWVVDNIASLAGGIDENSKRDWDPVNTWLLDLRFAGITTILLHHVNKDGGQRGTSAREDNLDMSILLEQPRDYEPEQGVDFVVKFSKSRLSFEDLHLIQELRFTLKRKPDGGTWWEWERYRAAKKQMITDMVRQGMTNADIAKEMKVSSAYVSKVRKEING